MSALPELRNVKLTVLALSIAWALVLLGELAQQDWIFDFTRLVKSILLCAWWLSPLSLYIKFCRTYISSLLIILGLSCCMALGLHSVIDYSIFTGAITWGVPVLIWIGFGITLALEYMIMRSSGTPVSDQTPTFTTPHWQFSKRSRIVVSMLFCLYIWIGIVYVVPLIKEVHFAGQVYTYREKWPKGRLNDRASRDEEVRYLHLHPCDDLPAVLPKILKLKNLSILSLAENQIPTPLSPKIGKLTKLRHLSIYGSNLTMLPPEIEQLTLLTHLRVNNNKLTALPPEIGNLRTLTHLDLAKNQFTSLPSGILQIEKLYELDLTANQLTTLPPEIGKLKELQELYLSGNQLTSLPPEIAELPKLRVLNLSNNNLSTLPPEFKLLTHRLWIDISGNKFSETDIEKLKKILPQCNIKH